MPRGSASGSTRPDTSVSRYPREIHLRDGSEAIIRPIASDDREALLTGFKRLSPASRYRRFLAPLDH
jgi:hypothetical protein